MQICKEEASVSHRIRKDSKNHAKLNNTFSYELLVETDMQRNMGATRLGFLKNIVEPNEVRIKRSWHHRIEIDETSSNHLLFSQKEGGILAHQVIE